MKIKTRINNLLRSKGYEIRKYPDPSEDTNRRMCLINYFGINKILDVGANDGAYSFAMRKFGFSGGIISFEPIKKVYNNLLNKSSVDPKWRAVNIALGNEDKETTINVSDNLVSSSILEMLPNHLNSSPESVYVRKEKITMRKMDTIFNDFCTNEDVVFLKIDTQGFNKPILDGAEKSLLKIKGIQIEMSIIPLYKDEMLYLDIIKYLENKGFTLFSLENGFFDKKSGRLLQADGIFFNNNNI